MELLRTYRPWRLFGFVDFESSAEANNAMWTTPAVSKAAITALNDDVQQHILSKNSLQLIKTTLNSSNVLRVPDVLDRKAQQSFIR